VPRELISSPRNAGQEVNFGIFRKRLIPGVAVDFAVDGDGDAALQVGLDGGVLLGQDLEKLADVFCLHRNGKRSANNWPERSPEVDFRHGTSACGR
jgi:hypothetical protein